MEKQLIDAVKFWIMMLKMDGKSIKEIDNDVIQELVNNLLTVIKEG